LPTKPIEDAGPLNGNIPPILISVPVTPGSSAAKTGEASSDVATHAAMKANLTLMSLSFCADSSRAFLPVWLFF
jgi:hypothetical protein